MGARGGALACACAQATSRLDDLARNVLLAALGAPGSPAQAEGFRQLLEEPPAAPTGHGVLHVNLYKPAGTPGAAQCPCHQWHVDKGLLTVVSTARTEDRTLQVGQRVKHENASF